MRQWTIIEFITTINKGGTTRVTKVSSMLIIRMTWLKLRKELLLRLRLIAGRILSVLLAAYRISLFVLLSSVIPVVNKETI